MTQTAIPKTDEIIIEAMNKIRKSNPRMLDPDYVRDNFSDAVETLFRVAYETYKGYEKEKINALAEETFLAGWSKNIGRKQALAMFRMAVNEAIKMEKSHSQSRSSRAGKSFEVIVGKLLGIAGIHSEPVGRKDKKTKMSRIDLVIPDRKTAVETPDKAHFLSLKTSLRERWKQVSQEQRPGQRTHLVTLLQKEILPNETAQEIVNDGIFLYVPDRVKDDRFHDEPRIRRLSDLPASVGIG